MTKITILISFLLLLLTSNLYCQELQYKFGAPTSQGISEYIKNNEEQFALDYQTFVKDTLYNDIYIVTLNFKKYFGKKYNRTTLAFNAISNNSSCEITVNNEERYTDYDYSQLKNKDSYTEFNYFVRATVMHEITHYYFMQIILEMQKIKNIEVSKYYTYNLTIIPNAEMQYGAKFIEEGICEYLKISWGLSPELRKDYKPSNKSEIITNGDKYEILYGFSSQFVKDFMDCNIKTFGRPKNAVMIILHNNPPSYEEILDPRLYFERLSIY